MDNKVFSSVNELAIRAQCAVGSVLRRGRALLAGESGQGTVEYAILVGVLVVVAIVAVTAFRGKIQELWSSIADGINSL